MARSPIAQKVHTTFFGSNPTALPKDEGVLDTYLRHHENYKQALDLTDPQIAKLGQVGIFLSVPVQSRNINFWIKHTVTRFGWLNVIVAQSDTDSDNLVYRRDGHTGAMPMLPEGLHEQVTAKLKDCSANYLECNT